MFIRFIKNHVEKLVFILLFLIIGYFASRLNLYLDDSYFYYLTTSKNLIESISIYSHDYGLFRPATLIYYNFIFPLYSAFPAIAHLIPVGLFTLSTYLIYKVLLFQKLRFKVAFLITIIIGSLPFVVEGYSWLAANSSIIVFFIFFLQIYVLESYGSSLPSFLAIFILQAIATITYETTFFMPLAFGLLWVLKKNKVRTIGVSIIEYLKIVFIFLLPAFLYISSFLLFPQRIESRLEFINISTAINHWAKFISDTGYLFSGLALLGFWGAQSLEGLWIILVSPIALILFIFLFVLIIYILFWKTYSFEMNIPDIKTKKFWFFAFILSLVPLTWQNNYLSFRTLILPTTLLIIFISQYFAEIINNLFYKVNYRMLLSFIKTIIIIFAILSFGLQIKIMDNYIKQYLDDVKITRELQKIILSKYPGDNDWIYVYLKSLPNNTLSSFVYSDYLLSSYYNYWTAEYFYRFVTGSWKNIAVEMHYNSIYRSKIPKDVLFKKRPLLTISFTDQKKCLQGKCLKLLEDSGL